MTKNNLREKIEECREEMITLSFTNDLTSEAVISSSIKLDQLLNEYQRYTQ
ncbi:Spo0E family sporulation regulatory protein-aspartic acid phosphatase [Oceanobacillus sp. CF4.6]|uniref:Spo0E family sporulation regulatory protein-aspartic acid phosphatase n=1 Tax=Oceanobacillus sp. CF4.6 TaxID=3373080 RepID=UPI003EE462BC